MCWNEKDSVMSIPGKIYNAMFRFVGMQEELEI